MSIFKEVRWNILVKYQDGRTQLIAANENQWFADPFLFEKDGKVFLFVELYPKWRGNGCIAFFDLSEQKPKPKIAIKEPFHMSFPNVFETENGIFMIPETSRGKRVAVYKATAFPGSWKYEKTLFSKAKYVDSAIVTLANQNHIFVTYDVEKRPFTLKTFFFDINKLAIGKPIQEIEDPNQELRPAGNSFFQDGEIILPTQNNIERYGKSVLLKYRFNADGNIEKRENQSEILPPQGYFGLHTLNRSETATVIDLQTKSTDFIRPLAMVVRRLRGAKKD